MREIKFRGKDIVSKEWVYGDLLQYQDGCAIRSCKGHYHYGVIPDTIGQYTGLKDKNGKEIYEGDIVYDLTDRLEYEVIWDEETLAFLLRACDGHIMSFFAPNEYKEVVGNIYDDAK